MAGPLIEAAELAAAIEGTDPPVLLDVRWTLGGPDGATGYAEGHLPGAVYLDLETVFAGPPGAGGRHPLPDPAVLQAALRAAGVDEDSDLVVYDGGELYAAARAWWVLRWAGHPGVRVLDGGLPAWRDAGGAVATAVPTPGGGDITVRPGSVPVLDADAAATVAREGLLIDVRAPERFRGEREPVDPVAGHIPGAINAPLSEDVGPDGRLRLPQELRDRYAALGVGSGAPVGTYCGSGVSAAQTMLALEVAGLDAALYVGSWSDWITDPARDVATG
jgi:thiosulfate/3-mercaptopyruvate sulfurtransferase